MSSKSNTKIPPPPPKPQSSSSSTSSSFTNTSKQISATADNQQNTSVSDRVQQWSRAIPEAGYITLGTLRYGVRLSNPNLTKSSICASSENTSVKSVASSNCTVRTQNSSIPSNHNNCCCIGATNGLVLPWHSNYVKTRLPVPNVGAKNRTSSPSSSSQSSARSSSSQLQQTAAASSVSPFIRDSSPTTTSACLCLRNNTTNPTTSTVIITNNNNNNSSSNNKNNNNNSSITTKTTTTTTTTAAATTNGSKKLAKSSLVAAGSTSTPLKKSLRQKICCRSENSSSSESTSVISANFNNCDSLTSTPIILDDDNRLNNVENKKNVSSGDNNCLTFIDKVAKFETSKKKSKSIGRSSKSGDRIISETSFNLVNQNQNHNNNNNNESENNLNQKNIGNSNGSSCSGSERSPVIVTTSPIHKKISTVVIKKLTPKLSNPEFLESSPSDIGNQHDRTINECKKSLKDQQHDEHDHRQHHHYTVGDNESLDYIDSSDDIPTYEEIDFPQSEPTIILPSPPPLLYYDRYKKLNFNRNDDHEYSNLLSENPLTSRKSILSSSTVSPTPTPPPPPKQSSSIITTTKLSKENSLIKTPFLRSPTTSGIISASSSSSIVVVDDQRNFNKLSPDSSSSSLNCFGKNQAYTRIVQPPPLLSPKNSTIAGSIVVGTSDQISPISMDRPRKTFERWMTFGRRSSNASATASNDDHSQKKQSDKSESLRQLTEKLRETRGPPIPPPRRPRQSHSVENSLGSTTGSIAESLNEEDSDHVMTPPPSNSIFSMESPSSSSVTHKTLRPNLSVSDLDDFSASSSNHTHYPVSIHEDEIQTNFTRPESKTIVGSYTQKSIPFRSASFSQVEYSSGKYFKSAIGGVLKAAKAALTKEKGVVVVPDGANLTWPRSRGPSPKKECPPLVASETMLNKSTIEVNHPMSQIVEVNDTLNNLALETACEVKEEENHEKINNNLTEENPIIQIADVVEAVELPQKTPEDNINETPTDIQILSETNIAQTSEIHLETLTEEEIPILPTVDDSFLQQATTCLIPVPVFECVMREWNAINPSEEWIDVKEEETPQMIEAMGVSLDMIQEINECDIEILKDVCSKPDILTDDCLNETYTEDDGDKNHAHVIETVTEMAETIVPVTIIDSQTLQENIAEEHNIKSEEDESEEVVPLENILPEELINEIFEPETVGVRKRHSNNNNQEGNPQKPNAKENEIHNNGSAINGEERRRIDKSRRRKGIYIQWPVVDKTGREDGSIESDAVTDENLTPEESNIVAWECEKIVGDDIEVGDDKRVINSRIEKLTSTDRKSGSIEPMTPEFEYSIPNFQRRKSLSCQSSEEKDDSQITGTPTIRAAKNLSSFIRQDSISDNECDRTPPRERSSASPAPYGDDLKRYSKRPLRGPYGQMLEAEMKKPGKMVYDEILEDLSRNDSSITSLNRIGQSFDDSSSHPHSDHHKVTAVSHPQRNSNSHLPIPCHVRSASTPSQMDSFQASDHLISHHRRYPSSIEPFNLKEMDKKKASAEKKLSLDSSVSNRNSSGASDLRLSTSSRTPSERSMMLNTSDTSKTGSLVTGDLLADLLKGSSERLAIEQREQRQNSLTPGSASLSSALPTAVLRCLDTRTHVVVELMNTEQSYVESLQTVIVKYMNPLKSPEYAGILDAQTVDEIFYKVPTILSLHEKFLEELRRRLDSWDAQQKVGDAFIEVFSKATVLETYMCFVNNCNRAKDAIRSNSSTRPQFARFLEAMTREHKRKLSLDNLLIKPVQKFPHYQLILDRLIKNTAADHPDQKPLQDAQKLVHDILQHLDCKKREAAENGQRESTLRELEGVIEGISDLVTTERTFLLFDLVSTSTGQATRKERGFFLFSDLLVITSIKRRGGTTRRPNLACPTSVVQTLDTNKYKFLTKITLDGLEIVKAKDENLKKILKEIENLTEDSNKLNLMSDIASSLRSPHQTLDESIRDLQREVQRQLTDRQSNDTQLSLLELTINSTNGTQNLSVVFAKPEKRNQWEETLTEAKQKLAASAERNPIPEFVTSIPIRKTRAGLQFTCAAPTLGLQHDVWVCNSDGYVGQVCVMSLVPEPTVTSCNGVCNARIMCIASVPASVESSNPGHGVSISIEDTTHFMQSSVSSSCPNVVSSSSLSDKQATTTPNSLNKSDSSDIQLDSGSSSDDSETETNQQRDDQRRVDSPGPASSLHSRQESNPDESDGLQPTMWLGTEDGCIHVYNCTDNIRTKKNKIKIQHITSVFSILYLDNRVFVSLANGDICVYMRDQCGWNTTSPLNISIGTVTCPVTKLLSVHGRLWCAIQGIIKVLNITTLQIENQIQISSDSKPITNMTVSNNNVWISVQNSAILKCFHSTSYELVTEVNLAPTVNKMLSNCDDIIRQHKAACLRVTSLLACKDLIWVGTSAGVLLTISGHNAANGPAYNPAVAGIHHGHTGHVRFLTYIENERLEEIHKSHSTNRHSVHAKQKDLSKILIISGGDGYEDFRNSGTNLLSEVAGREDSTNHLLLWHV